MPILSDLHNKVGEIIEVRVKDVVFPALLIEANTNTVAVENLFVDDVWILPTRYIEFRDVKKHYEYTVCEYPDQENTIIGPS